MACMCGDTQCWSCGPAQGNWQCPICRAWADDGCDHIDEETGTIKEEFKSLAEQKDREVAESEDAMAREYEEEKQFVRNHPEWFDAHGKYRS